MSQPEQSDLHTDRARAGSFGSVAAEYDRLRPTYPDALVTSLLARGPVDVLDVGCGTGKLSRLLAAGGVEVLGLEPDAAMAEVARGHGLAVEVAPFETWDDAGRRFDLITCAQAWHWVDPVIGPARAHAVLRPGGALALCWNMGDHPAGLRTELDEVYRREAPQLAERATAVSRHVEAGPMADRMRSAGFDQVTTREFPWVARYATDAWLGLLATYSDHHLLPAPQWARLRAELAAAADARGGSVEIQYRTLLVLAVRR